MDFRQGGAQYMLYKYVVWNEDTIKDLTNGQLWFNTPDKFNDPFDMLAYYSLKSNDAIGKIHSSIGKIKGFDDSDILKVQRLTEYEGAYHKRYGITCFSCNETENILLWSHYAKKHTGICLGFEIENDDEHAYDFMPCLRNKDFSSKLFKMTYVSNNNRPMQNDDDLLLKKFNVWSYEKECRIMVRSENRDCFPKAIKYRQDRLKKIILGARFKVSGLSELKDCLSSYNIDTIDFNVVILDDVEYKLNIKDLPISEMKIICKNVMKSSDVEYGICLSHIIEDLRKCYSDNEIKDAWNNAFNNMPLCVLWKFFPMIKKEFFWEKAVAKSLSQDECIEIGMFRSYMENQTKFELEKPSKGDR